VSATDLPDPTSDDAQQRFAAVANEQAGTPPPPTAPVAPERLDPALAQAWARDGYLVLRGVLEPALVAAVEDEAVALVRELAATGEELGGYRRGDGMVSVPEPNLAGTGTRPEDHVSKLFNLHRRPPFRLVANHPAIVAVLVGLLGPDVDCFNSQFIFKNPGAWGQPWHQDSLYFALERGPQVGVWLATSQATAENGCLFVLPGSHTEPLHEHVPDRRPGANLGYLEIVDHDTSGEVPVEMAPGDVLLFHSFLMHRSGDNGTGGRRTALVLHHTPGGTADSVAPGGTIDPVPVAAAWEPLA